MILLENKTLDMQEASQANARDELARTCNVLGIDSSIFNGLPTPLVAASVAYTTEVVGNAVEQYYAEPDMDSLLPIQKASLLEELIKEHAVAHDPTEQLDAIIHSVTAQKNKAKSYGAAAKNIILQTMLLTQISATNAVLNVKNAYERNDVAAYETAKTTLELLGFTLPELPSTPNQKATVHTITVRPIRKPEANAVSSRTAKVIAGTAIAGALTFSAISPAAAEDVNPVPSVSTQAVQENQQPMVVAINPLNGQEVHAPKEQVQTAQDNKIEAQEVIDVLNKDVRGALWRLAKTAKSGNLHDMSTSEDDVYAVKDPRHPSKKFALTLSPELQADIAATVSLLQGILANDAEVIAVLTDYYKQNPLSEEDAKLIQLVNDVSFSEQGNQDLSDIQKNLFLMVMNEINTKTIASVNKQYAVALAEHTKELAAEQQRRDDELIGKNTKHEHPTTADRYSAVTPLIVDKAKLAQAIDEYIADKEPDSPMQGMGKYFVEGGLKWGVNPVYLAASARLESQFCGDKNSVCNHRNTNNAWNRECPSDKPNIAYQDGYSGYHHHACAYESFKDSLTRDDFTGKRAASEGYDSFPQYLYRKYISKGKKTIRQILASFTPASEAGNDKHQRLIHDYEITMDQIYELAGDSIQFKRTNTHSSVKPTITKSKYVKGSQFPVKLPDGMIYVSQWDNRWAEKSYNKSNGEHKTIASSGCSPTTAAWVMRVLGIDSTETPLEQAAINQRNGGRDSSRVAFRQMAERNDLSFKDISGLDTYDRVQAVYDALQINPSTGRPNGVVVASGSDSDTETPFTKSGHVLGIYRAKSNGSVKVMDPNSLRKSKKWWSKSDIIARASYLYILSK